MPAFSAIFLSSAQQKLMQTGAPILTYHKIALTPSDTRDPFLYVAPTRFENHLASLQNAGFSSASLDQLVDPREDFAKKIVLTFDDGCQNVWQNGLPLLAKYQFQAIQFLVSDFLGKRNEWDIAKGDLSENLMDDAQIKDWLAAGHTIGSHSLTHPNLCSISRRQASQEIFDSRKKLEDKFNVSIRHFCYPFGSWNPFLRDLVQEAGYATACTVKFGVNPPEQSRFSLRRITPLSSREWIAKAMHRLRRKISGA